MSDRITEPWVKLCNLYREKTIMLAVLIVMTDMDLPHDLLGYGWVGSSGLTRSRWVGLWYATGESL
jgi:hypothetical protein